MNLRTCHSLHAIAHLILAGVSAWAADPIAKAGNGMPIMPPTDKTTAVVKEGDKTIQIPAGMVYVPAGSFTFGQGEMRDLPGYAIARFEVTNAEYKAFLEATGHRGTPRHWKGGMYPEGKAAHPVLFVSLVDAEAYCAWISKETGRKIRVPTAEEWEKAARGPKAFLYPWGNDKDSRFSNGRLQTHFNYNAVCAAYMLDKEAKTVTRYVEKSQEAGKQGRVEDIMTSNGQVFSLTSDGGVNGWIDHNTNTGFVNTQLYRDLVENGGFTTAVGAYESGKSAYGCYDMAGNVYEWTSSVIVATNGAERGKEVNDVRGGSWYSTGRSGQSLCTGEGRNRSGGYHSVGFRIAMTP